MKSKSAQNGLKAPTKDLEISFLVPTPVGFNGEELQIFLQENNVCLDAFAKIVRDHWRGRLRSLQGLRWNSAKD